ncbi:hypothetical protein ANO11243_019850 [Dothideomycetidae sp. 11243]|nr:hypothetical protein ANO11243_019850 [fungal sp. No.11243]
MRSSRRTAAAAGTPANGTRTTTTKPSLMQRLRGAKGHTTTTQSTKHSHNPLTGSMTTTTTEKVTTHGTSATTPTTTGAGIMGTGSTTGVGRRSKRRHRVAAEQGVVHQQRNPSVGDKMSGAMMRLKGSLGGRSGVKGAGTRRMRGTDGRGATRI